MQILMLVGSGSSYAAYVRFFEQARTESLRQAGLELHVLFEKYGILFAIKKIMVSYLKPARLDNLLYIKVKKFVKQV